VHVKFNAKSRAAPALELERNRQFLVPVGQMGAAAFQAVRSLIGEEGFDRK